MYKKTLAILLICTLLVSISPAVAADPASAQPTVEEILSSYHQKAFQAEKAEALGTASVHSRGSTTSGKTLEQETVEELTAAGYEAYNVTASNYDALETTLKTDFASIGLDPNGSYIVVIGGEDPAPANTRGFGDNLITPTPGDPNEGNGIYEYTYNGTTYTMRYVTITANDNPNFRKFTSVDLLASYSDSFLDRLLNFSIEGYLNSLNKYVPIGSILSLLGMDYSGLYRTAGSDLEYHAGTIWTRSYIQILNSDHQSWSFASCAEYVKLQSHLSGTLYNSETISFDQISENITTRTVYSEDYYNTNQRILDAVLGYLSYDTLYDLTGDVIYYLNGSMIVRHNENFA